MCAQAQDSPKWCTILPLIQHRSSNSISTWHNCFGHIDRSSEITLSLLDISYRMMMMRERKKKIMPARFENVALYPGATFDSIYESDVCCMCAVCWVCVCGWSSSWLHSPQSRFSHILIQLNSETMMNCIWISSQFNVQMVKKSMWIRFSQEVKREKKPPPFTVQSMSSVYIYIYIYIRCMCMCMPSFGHTNTTNSV